MKLDRNAKGRGKYGLIKNRVLDALTPGVKHQAEQALTFLQSIGVYDPADTTETEAFIIRLRDRYAGRALKAYSDHAQYEDPEYAAEVRALSQRSGYRHPNWKNPD